jgi:hypothetical protein
MLLGPYAVNLLTQDILDNSMYHTLIELMECGMGLMLGSEMVWRKMRSSGKQIVVITLAQSLMTFAVVSLAFSAIFYFMDIPVFWLDFWRYCLSYRTCTGVIHCVRI